MMGQVQNKNERVPFDENDNNGLILSDAYIPEEVLANILFYVHYKTLARCMLVCKRWNDLIRNYVWRKKCEMILSRSVQLNDQIPWTLYYLICKPGNPFERNLIMNHSGNEGVKKHWKILRNSGSDWAVEKPPKGVPPLPETEPIFKDNQVCFVTSFEFCSKVQEVDLIAEGLTSQILDDIQPPIIISEWYSARWDCRAIYQCSATLIGENNDVLDSFEFQDVLEGEKQNCWLQVTHEFENYGKGLRKISYWHQGKDAQWWRGPYGSKMAGACVRVKIPI